MKHKKHSHSQKTSPTRSQPQIGSRKTAVPGKKKEVLKLEVVLKCDLFGTEEAIIPSLESIQKPEVAVKVIHTDVGSITKSDLLLAQTGSRLVIGFNVDVAQGIEMTARDQGIEIRLYNVIYRLINDVRQIVDNLIPPEEEERITGKAKIIELFKSRRGGIILGCDVQKGTLAGGKAFRVIGAMGILYSGKIESLHIEKGAVKEAKVGQQVGLKISDFTKAKIGDIVECFEIVLPKADATWQPKGGVFHFLE